MTSILWTICPANPLLRNVANVAERGAVWLLSDVEPRLVPLGEGGVPRAAEVTVLHPVVKIEVYSTCNLRASNYSLLPQTKQIAKEIEMRLYPNIGLA